MYQRRKQKCLIKDGYDIPADPSVQVGMPICLIDGVAYPATIGDKAKYAVAVVKKLVGDKVDVIRNGYINLTGILAGKDYYLGIEPGSLVEIPDENALFEQYIGTGIQNGMIQVAMERPFFS